MKKKFYNRLLVVAMLLATAGSYVSCKDYDEEAYADMLGKNSKLEEIVNEQVDLLNGQIVSLEKAQEQCKANCEAWKKEIELWKESLKLEYVTITDFNKHITEYNNFLTQNETRLRTIEGDIADAKRTLINVQGDLVKAKEELGIQIGALDTKLSQLATDLENNVIAFNDAIKKNSDRIDTAEDAIQNLRDEINNDLKVRISANENAIKTLETTVKDIQTSLNETALKAKEAYELAERDSTRIDILEKNYADLRKDLDEMESLYESDKANLIAKIDSICSELKTAKATANEALALAKDNLDKAKAYTDDRINLAKEELRNEVNITLAALEKAYENADKKLQDQIDDLKEGVAEVEKRVAENEKNIDELVGKVNKVDKALQQFISGIILQRAENPVFGSFAFPANIQTNVLMAFYGYAGSYGAQFPTYYPRYYVRGAEALTPTDLKMLGVAPVTLAEDGDAIISSAGKVYVTVNPSNVNFEGQTLPIVNSLDEESGVELAPLKYSDKKLTFGVTTRAAVNGFYEAEAILAPENLHKVKMTFDLNVGEFKETIKDIINPLDGVNVSQVASTVFDVVSQFNQELDANALKASWTDTLGVSRNTYSQYNLATTAIKPLSYAFMADANFTSFPGFDKMRNVAGKLMDKMANKFKIAIDKMPEFDFDVKHINHINFTDIDLGLDNSDIKLKVTYTDTLTKVIDIKEYIKYDIKDSVVINDTTIKVPVHAEVKDNVTNDPIGYIDFIQDVTIPGEIIKIHLQDSVLFEYKDTIEFVIDNVELEINNDDLQDLFDQIGLGDIEKALGDTEDKVNDIIDKINSYLDKLEDLTKLTDKVAEIGSKVDDVNDKLKNKIINFLDKVEGKLLTAVNSINKAVQPVMLVKTADSFQMLSQTVYSPTVMTAANVQFIPTSYTAELVAPAFKKLVGVTNVFSMDRSKSAQNNDANCLSALKEANAKAGVAEILNGDTQIINFSAKKGYIYEVTYTSVDFSGFVAAKKYYVTVK